MLITAAQSAEIMQISKLTFWQRVYTDYSFPKRKAMIEGRAFFDLEEVQDRALFERNFERDHILLREAGKKAFGNSNAFVSAVYHAAVIPFNVTFYHSFLWGYRPDFERWFNAVADGVCMVRLAKIQRVLDMRDYKFACWRELVKFHQNVRTFCFKRGSPIYCNRLDAKKLLQKFNLNLH